MGDSGKYGSQKSGGKDSLILLSLPEAKLLRGVLLCRVANDACCHSFIQTVEQAKLGVME